MHGGIFYNTASCITFKVGGGGGGIKMYSMCITLAVHNILLRITEAIKILGNNFLLVLFFANNFLIQITLFCPSVMLIYIAFKKAV